MIRDTEIKFDSVEHAYTGVQSGRPYEPATGVVSKVFDDFDIEYWSMAKAIERIFVRNYGWDRWNDKKRELKGYQNLVAALTPIIPTHLRLKVQQEIKEEWGEITEDSIILGNHLHGLQENDINQSIVNRKTKYVSDENGILQMNVPISEIIKGYFTEISLDLLAKTALPIRYPDVYKRIVYFVKKGFSVYAEARVFSPDYYIAGTIDLLLIKGKSFIILDWKTNKKIPEFEAGYYVKKNGVITDKFVKTNDKLKPPLDHLPQCKGMHYTLQLSLYAYLLELLGFRCMMLELYHIRETSTAIPITYLRDDIKLLLDANKAGLLN